MSGSSTAKAGPAGDEAASAARQLLQQGFKGSLATLGNKDGCPFVSLIAVGLGADGGPVSLLSRLAVHTQNLTANPGCSLLFDGTGGLADALTGMRVTTVGRAEQIAPGTPFHASVRSRFLARHPSAQVYVDFADFSFWRFGVERAHLIGGFGRIHEIPGHMLLGDAPAERLLAAEPEIIAHMNSEHAAAVGLYATRLLVAKDGAWRFAGIDPHGADLVLETVVLRLPFPEPVTTPGGAQKMLADLAKKARG